jgi:hypothetical protein
MGNIKKPSSTPAMQMLMDNAFGILHRHGITGKSRHFGTQLPMQIIQRGLFQIRHTILLANYCCLKAGQTSNINQLSSI